MCIKYYNILMVTKSTVFNNWNKAIIITSIITIIACLIFYFRLRIPRLATESSDNTSSRFINSNK
jgi:hypothetical protein